MSNWHDTKPSRGGLNREHLPNPQQFYQSILRKLGKTSSTGWASALCPFHNDHNPSFTVNLHSGGFKCHGCGVKGGDVISFYIALHHIDFVDACRALGAWEESND